MTSSIDTLDAFLICRIGTRTCGFPLEHVIETMRLLPVETFPDMLPCMSGMAIIRGARVPVINLANLLGEKNNAEITRYVTVRLGQRQAAFAVGSVNGVEHFPADSLDTLPPLLGDAGSGIVAAVGTLDDRLMLVLEAARIIPESHWQALDAHGRRP